MKKKIILSAVFTLVIPSFLMAQREKKQTSYTVYINKSDTLVKADVMAKKPTFSASDDKTYYWYASTNKVIQTMGGYDGKPLHGKYSSFYGSKNLFQKGKFKKGLKTGEWTTWFTNGKINETSRWKNGKKNGKLVLYTETGQPMLMAHFRNDRLHGTMTSYQNGKILNKAKYKHGVQIIHNEKLPKAKEGKKIKNSNVKQADKKTFKESFKAWFGKVKSKLHKKPTQKEGKKKENPPTSKA